MATPAVQNKNAQRYIVVGLMGTLTVAIVVTIFFIVMCPAHINFSVTHAGSHYSSDGGGGVQLVLTLTANNTSRRTAVRYQSMFIDVKNSTRSDASAGYSVRADLTTAMPLSQRRASAVNVGATVLLVDTPWTEGFTGNGTCDTFAVIVTAVVRFRIGIARTRLYDIKVSCGPVSFFPAAAEHSGAPAGHLPANCV
uniref:Late embryogenesis abundant protein LEA-2 subgroup domain-containing protein n=1 Tax=Arundo donax TaxID=35708 RepID=A0A0A9DRQ9_ARUDO